MGTDTMKLFQYSISRGKLPLTRHVISEGEVLAILGKEEVEELKSGKTSVIAVPLDPPTSGHVNYIYREVWEITCKRCQYNVFGLKQQLARIVDGDTHYGHYPKALMQQQKKKESA